MAFNDIQACKELMATIPLKMVESFLNFSQSETRFAHVDHVFWSNRYEMRKCYRGLFIDASCKILLYLAKWFQGKRLLEIEQPETRISYGGHVWEYKISNLYREPSIEVPTKFRFVLAKRLLRSFLEINQPESRIPIGGHV